MRDLKEALAEPVSENWLVERSHVLVRRTLEKLTIPCTTFYRCPDRGDGGPVWAGTVALGTGRQVHRP